MFDIDTAMSGEKVATEFKLIEPDMGLKLCIESKAYILEKFARTCGER
jgi:hypothetical protein